MAIRNYTFLVIVFLLCLRLSGQNVEFDAANFKDNKEGLHKAKNNIMLGNDLFDQESEAGYNNALAHYLEANSFNPNNASLNYKIGLCYLHSTQKDKSLPFFTKAFELKNSISTDIHYLLAQANQYAAQFEKAQEEYTLYKNSLSEESQKRLGPTIGKRIEECQAGAELIKNPVKCTIETLGLAINSSYPDYCPLISADESMMIFTSRRENTTGGGKDPNDDLFFEDIYVSNNVNGNWEQAKNIGKPLNTETHDATVGLSPDGQQLFIYNGKINNGDIFVCKLDGDNWSNPKPLPRNINSDFHESSACFSFDGNTIYFVSDKLSDNYGGRDIFYSQKDAKGNWSDPKNIGPVINTPYDEDDVFIHPDGRTLNFSSKGHNSMGGYDIFKSVLDENGQWGNPENIGWPINSPEDDRYFVSAASGKHSYYSSIRDSGLGSNDIYRITYAQDEQQTKIDVVLLTILKGKVTDAMTQQPLEATIEIVDNVKNEKIATFTSNSKTGKYLVSLPSGVNYGIVVKADDYLFHSENFNLPDSMAFQEVVKNIALDKLSQGSKVILNNIFFDYAKSTLQSASFAELDRIIELLNKYPTMRIEIGGHTDNLSSIETNKKLSESRAKSVVDYLIFEGIDKKRLEFKGYAFYQPIATNDTEEGRQQNRRVEFKILSK